MNGPYRTHEMFSGGNCILCNWQVRGTANRNRHLDKHVREGRMEEGGDRGLRWYIRDAARRATGKDDG